MLMHGFSEKVAIDIAKGWRLMAVHLHSQDFRNCNHKTEIFMESTEFVDQGVFKGFTTSILTVKVYGHLGRKINLYGMYICTRYTDNKITGSQTKIGNDECYCCLNNTTYTQHNP